MDNNKIGFAPSIKSRVPAIKAGDLRPTDWFEQEDTKTIFGIGTVANIFRIILNILTAPLTIILAVIGCCCCVPIAIIVICIKLPVAQAAAKKNLESSAESTSEIMLIRLS